MGISVGEKPLVYLENSVADELARQTAETWRELHKGDVVAEPIYDERGKQINYLDRSETLVADTPTHTIILISDGTVRKDNKTPAPPAPPVDQQPKPHYRYSREDLARLHSEDRVTIRCGGSEGMQAHEKESPDNLSSRRRRDP